MACRRLHHIFLTIFLQPGHFSCASRQVQDEVQSKDRGEALAVLQPPDLVQSIQSEGEAAWKGRK